MRNFIARMVLVAATWFLTLTAVRADNDFLSGVNRVLFLGDSITYDGRYISIFETEIRLRYPQKKLEVLNLGLPSETVSGLSEDGHAGGKFPRPTVHERLKRVLEKTKPQLVFACYGMNDGIYLPLSNERFGKFKEGMIKLHEEVEKAGAKIIHLTPAVFDPVPIRNRVVSADRATGDRMFEGYNGVLDAYSAWLREKGKKGWTTYCLHEPMNEALATARAKMPNFTFAGDGVHPNLDGQLILAAALCKASGLAESLAVDEYRNEKSVRARTFKLIQQRQRLLTDAWLTDTGHLRPMPKGLPLAKAQERAAELDSQWKALLSGAK